MTVKLPTAPHGAEEPHPEDDDREAARLIREAFEPQSTPLPRAINAARFVGPEALLLDQIDRNKQTPN